MCSISFPCATYCDSYHHAIVAVGFRADVEAVVEAVVTARSPTKHGEMRRSTVREMRMLANGILNFSPLDFSGMAAQEFPRLAEFKHIPERLGVPGFRACERWIGADNQKISVATYELDNADVLKSPAYNAIGNHALGGDRLSVRSKRLSPA